MCVLSRYLVIVFFRERERPQSSSSVSFSSSYPRPRAELIQPRRMCSTMLRPLSPFGLVQPLRRWNEIKAALSIHHCNYTRTHRHAQRPGLPHRYNCTFFLSLFYKANNSYHLLLTFKVDYILRVHTEKGENDWCPSYLQENLAIRQSYSCLLDMM